MATGVKGFHHGDFLAIAAHLSGDVERMPRSMIQKYYERHLQQIEDEIRTLGEQIETSVDRPSLAGLWPGQLSSRQSWESLADLSYLLAVRDALKDTIRAL